MTTRFFSAIWVLLLVFISGCATVEKTAFTPELKKSIKTIGVVGVVEPDQYFLYPGQIPGGAALYAFGALGGLILGSIDVMRFERASNEFTASVKPTRPDVANFWNESISSLLQAKNYQVTLLPPLPKKDGLNEVDCSSVADKFDALLISNISTGYAIEGMVEPRVTASVRLASSNCSKTHFLDSYIYSANAMGKLVHISRDANTSFATQEALIADPAKAKSGLHTGLSEVAKRATSEF